MRRRRFLQIAPMALTPLVSRAHNRHSGRFGLLGPAGESQGTPDRWPADGWGASGQLGLLMPHTDVEPDSEFAALAPDGVSIHAMRVRWRRLDGLDAAVIRARAFVEPPGLDDAAETLVDIQHARPKAIALCFTSASYVLGPAADAALKARLEQRTGGIPIAITCLAATSAPRAFKAQRIAVVNPPWFTEDMDRRSADYFKGQGFDVVYHGRALVRKDRGNVLPAALYEWTRKAVPAAADAVFFGGNGMRTIGAIQALEDTLGKLVITSNQVAFWAALRLANILARITGYGQLFEK